MCRNMGGFKNFLKNNWLIFWDKKGQIFDRLFIWKKIRRKKKKTFETI
jgi:hypothetical protein